MSHEPLRRAVAALLAIEPTLTPARIRERIGQLRPTLAPELSDDGAERMAREFESLHNVVLGSGVTLRGREFHPWLDQARAGIDPYYWDRYRKLLENKALPRKVISSIDGTTDEVLGLLGNPDNRQPWDRRGLVVGYVQSGKTANYIGLCCKAADARYRVIIIIAGIHNRLRRQTQKRVDEGFIGRDTSRTSTRTTFVGVGTLDPRRQPTPFTHATSDFDRDTAHIPLQNLKEPAVFVIKKNHTTLDNLLSWLMAHNRRHETETITEPLLLIDDEADNASINITRGPEEASRINSQIRDVLKLFDRSCYVGYTATPFANIFIEPETETAMFGDDLFPRDFIKSLDAPSNYFGPAQVFRPGSGRNPVRQIADHEDLLPTNHKKEQQLDALPDSLLHATQIFLLACAIRRLRGHANEHKSMLVNASRFTAVQAQIRHLLHDFVDRIRGSVRVHGRKPAPEADRIPEIRRLREAFEQEYATCGTAWDDVLRELLEATSAVGVVEINNASAAPLDYDESEGGRSVIAVGGYSLSRGLTLEGLIVSYFLRNSLMYDTLMQMGRWFGYREGYKDLCRIWMLEEAEGWYSHIADSIEELRRDLRDMSQIGATPKEFGLRVRSHPDALIVTARNKKGSGQIFRHSIGLANEFVETARLARNPVRQQRNRNAARRLAERMRAEGWALEDGECYRSGRFVTGVPVAVVREFIADFENDRSSTFTERDPLCRYIDMRSDELRHWDVYVPGVRTESGYTLVDESLGFRLLCQQRSEGRSLRGDPHTLMVTSRQRVASRGVEKMGLTDEQIAEAERSYREDPELTTDTVNYPDHIYRDVRDRPLLIVHLLAIGGQDEDLSAQQPIVAYSISFPKTDRREDTVEYMVNTTWMRQLDPADADEDEMSGDDD